MIFWVLFYWSSIRSVGRWFYEMKLKIVQRREAPAVQSRFYE